MKMFTLAEAAKALGVDQATLYRWLARLSIQPVKDSADSRKRLLTLAQVRELARLHQRKLPDESIVDIVQDTLQFEDEIRNRLRALEDEVRALQAQLTEGRQPLRTLLTPARPEYTIAPTEDIAPGSVLLHQLAKAHGVNRRSFWDQVQKHGLAHTAIRKKNRPGEKNRWFSPAQQGAVIAFWQANGTPYTACEQCPHK